MTFEIFRASLTAEDPPSGISAVLTAMWWDAKPDWNRAHEIAQDVDTPDGAWVHAYLHRKERDEGNAGYWYRQAGRPRCRQPLAVEWEEMVRAFLTDPLTAAE